ncbi:MULTISPECIES: DUF402 domain-containing protein [unclassified Kitasatospora]|uniref:DUF402 domain-containing protein n=1 Tax=unclassified Kitasatospora TaxID=2633591 RepID=UPI00382285C5
MTANSEKPFEPGATAVRRDIMHGKVWTAMPLRTLADTGDTLALAAWPGIESLAPTTWITSLRTGDEAVRKQGIADLAAGRWELGRWVWRDTTVLSCYTAGEYFSVHRFLDEQGRPLRWYVNFELPHRRTAIGIDTFDLFLDLVAAPDLSTHAWKDEDEYAQARRLGLIDDAHHRLVDQARDRALGLLRRRQGPFAPAGSTWTPPPLFPLPTLPDTALSAPPARP